MAILRYDLEIFPYDIDFMGHVNNVVYVRWMEIGRTKLLEAVGLPMAEIAEQGVVPVLRHTAITYKSPLQLGESVQASLWLADLRHASARMAFQFHSGDRLAAEGQQQGLFVDRTSGRPRRLSPQEKARFMPYVVATPGTDLNPAPVADSPHSQG